MLVYKDISDNSSTGDTLSGPLTAVSYVEDIEILTSLAHPTSRCLLYSVVNDVITQNQLEYGSFPSLKVQPPSDSGFEDRRHTSWPGRLDVQAAGLPNTRGSANPGRETCGDRVWPRGYQLTRRGRPSLMVCPIYMLYGDCGQCHAQATSPSCNIFISAWDRGRDDCLASLLDTARQRERRHVLFKSLTK